MSRIRAQLSTGLPGLDHVLRGLMPGDNIVWQIESVQDYLPFVKPYCAYARENRHKLVYFRFAEHPPLLSEQDGAQVCRLDARKGFDPFLSGFHEVINQVGRGSLFLFDCLSELAADWCSDRMLGNFFMLTCPYLYDRAAIAYFAVLRHRHSFHAARPITNTTQILLDVYRHKDKLYVHPIKVQHRHSTTMYMLHAWEGDDFQPVTQSCIITEILERTAWSRQDAASYLLGYWSRTLAEAETIQHDLDTGRDRREEAAAYFQRLLRMLISTDENVLRLAREYLTLRDLLNVRRRMIGTGLLGGKTVGMLLARAILRRSDPRWDDMLESHDSFYVGADVFYTYLVQNGCWWMIQKTKTAHGITDETETARRRVLAGDFPDYIVAQFADMLDYFGQSPIIVRSSSLLEDNFGNAFAGKYESVFCANQGGPHKRLEDFLCAVRTVYASTMGEDALLYRSKRGLLHLNEQMGLLIQRVSGATYGNLFFPQAAGVAFSFNPYVWHETIDPTAGVLRLVFGVGTRAVDRADDDYTRLVALNAPQRRPETSFDEVRDYAQRKVDVLDLEANQLASTRFEDILRKQPDLPLEMFTSRDRSRSGAGPGDPALDSVLTFDRLLADTPFVADMRRILRTLQDAYQCPVDMEFTLNFFEKDRYKINVLQCRPLQVRELDPIATPPDAIPPDDLLMNFKGPIIGKSAVLEPGWFVYVTPAVYGELPVPDRHAVARVIGDVCHHEALAGRGPIMLLGPGRWGTKSPSLGIPVAFADIDTASVICEIVSMRQDLVPDVSLGTHFLNELVEMDMLYLAFFPKKDENTMRADLFEAAPNRLAELLPDEARWAAAVRVIRASDLAPAGTTVILNANVLDQRAVCYFNRRRPPEDAPESALEAPPGYSAPSQQ
jgi:hypothetical protein